MNEIEMRARELLAQAYFKRCMSGVAMHISAKDFRPNPDEGAALDAIIAALTPPEGYVLVPLEPTEEMIEAAQDANMPFGDMGFAISAAIAARPEVK